MLKNRYILLIVISTIVFGFNFAYADRINYDINSLDLTWNSASTAILLDVDENGIVDRLYRHSGTSTVTLTKVLGTGSTQTLSTAGSTLNAVNANKDLIFVTNSTLTGGSCSVTLSYLNTTSSTKYQNALTSTLSAGTGGSDCKGQGYYNYVHNQPMLALSSRHTTPTSTDVKFVLLNGTTIVSTSISASENVDSTNNWYGLRDGAVHPTSKSLDTNNQQYDGTNSPAVGLVSTTCPTTAICMTQSSGELSKIVASYETATTTVIDETVSLYDSGHNIGGNYGHGLPEKKDYWTYYLYDTPRNNNLDKLVTAHYRILDPTLTTDVLRIKMQIDSIDYIGYLTGSNLKYAVIPSTFFNNRSIEHYLIDDSPTVYETKLTTAVPTSYTMDLQTSDTTYNDVSMNGIISIISGNKLWRELTDSFVVARSFDSIVNDQNVKPILTADTTELVAHTTLTFIVKNAFPASDIKIQDTALYDTNQQSVAFTSTDTILNDFDFSNNGKILLITGDTNNKIYELNMPVPYKPAYWDYDSKYFKLTTTQDDTPIASEISDDGLSVWLLGNNSDDIFKYTLSKSNRISTATISSQTYSFTSQDSSPVDFKWNNDGTKIYVVGDATNTIYQYSLSNAYNVTSISYNNIFSTISEDSSPKTIQFNTDGTKMYMLGTATNKIYQYILNTPFDISTKSYNGKYFAITGLLVNEPTPTSFFIDSTGTSIYVMGSTTDKVYRLQLNTAWDIETIGISQYPYIWSQGQLQADKSYSVELPSGTCKDIFIRDASVTDINWESLGSLCASGVMPKSITYSANLGFTFWSLPYGVSHTFNQGDEELTTKVRHDTAPYSYTVKVFDANGAEQSSDFFTANSTTIDTQVISTNNVTLPAIVRVYDNNNEQIYYGNLGVPSYLSGVGAWFDEWLTIEGFNLLFMLPIIFGAMFTRNTVGIGTMSTVVLIATLNWFGLIAIPETALYLMIFVAVIGVIAYKKLYD